MGRSWGDIAWWGDRKGHRQKARLSRPRPHARSKAQRVDPRVGQHLSQLLAALHFAQHDGIQPGGILRHGRGRAGQGHHPRPDPQRTTSGQAGGPGATVIARDDQGMAVGVFVASGFSKPGWAIDRASVCQVALRQVDVDDSQGAAPLWAVLQNMAKFRAMEGHRQIGRCRRSKDLAAVGTKTARGVHRDDPRVAKICGLCDKLKRPCGVPVHRSRQARSKQRVNKQKRTRRWTLVCIPETQIGKRA